MFILRSIGPMAALGASLLATSSAGEVRWHPEPELDFPASSTFSDFPDARPLLKTVVEIMNSHGYNIIESDMEEGVIGGKLQIDGNTSEVVVFRLTRDIEGDDSIQLEWLYGQYVVAFGSPEPRRIVVKQESAAMQNVIKEVQLAVILGP
jgi:hypothetical protein